MRARWRTTVRSQRLGILPLLLAALCALVPQHAAPEAHLPQSHLRMRALLAEIAAAYPDGDFYPEEVPRLERELEALRAGAAPTDRFRILGALGEAYLRAGAPERAIATFERIERAAAADPEAAGQFAPMAEFLLGVVHLWRGQDVNCGVPVAGGRCVLSTDAPGFPDRVATEQAIRRFEATARSLPVHEPLHVASRWLLNVGAMMLGDDHRRIPSDLLIDASVFEPPLSAPFPRFRDAAPQSGLATVSQAGGAVVDDLDGDGRLDVLVSSLDPVAPLRLLLNRGGRGFVDASAERGPAGITGGLNLVPADYDNDGDLDVYVTRGAWMGDRGRWPDSLLRNDGGRFVDVSLDVGLGAPGAPTQAAAWADFDLDGDLDLYVANETRERGVHASALYENRNGRFVDVAPEAGVANFAFGKGVAWGDYDSDGDPDLYVSNLGGANRLYRNDGDGSFTNVAPRLGVTGPRASFVPWFWDVNNDGHLDLFVNAYQEPVLSADRPGVWTVAASRLGIETAAPLPALYLNDGQGGFRDVAAAWGLDRPWLPMGANFGDLDNDGYPDIYLGTGYPGIEGLVPNVMLRNVEGRGFEEVTFAGGFGHLGKGHGIAFADVDDDGDQDVFSQLGGMRQIDRAPDALFENPGFGNHWIKLRLVDDGRTTRGARIEARIRENGRSRSVHGQVGQGGSFGAGPRRLELGLGGAAMIGELRIRWPGAPGQQVFFDVAADRFLEIRRDEPSVREVPLAPFRLPAAPDSR